MLCNIIYFFLFLLLRGGGTNFFPVGKHNFFLRKILQILGRKISRQAWNNFFANKIFWPMVFIYEYTLSQNGSMSFDGQAKNWPRPRPNPPVGMATIGPPPLLLLSSIQLEKPKNLGPKKSPFNLFYIKNLRRPRKSL